VNTIKGWQKEKTSVSGRIILHKSNPVATSHQEWGVGEMECSLGQKTGESLKWVRKKKNAKIFFGKKKHGGGSAH